MKTASHYLQTIQKDKTKSTAIVIAGSIALLCSRYIYKSLKKKYDKEPPGPIGVPLFGSLLSMGKDQSQFLLSLKSYGDIACCTLGTKKFIISNSPSIVKEIYIKNKLINVYPLTSDKTNLMFIGINGTEWNKRRKIIHVNLMNVLTSNVIQYISKETLQDIIYPKIDKWIKNKTKNGFNLNGLFSPVSFNVVFFAIFGAKFDDKFYEKFTAVQKALFSSVGAEHGMRWLLGETIYSIVRNNKIEVYQKEIISMLSEFDAKKQSKDEYDQQLIDFKPFIAYVHESKENDDQMSRDKLLGDCGMILGAATDTTATTLEFCILVAIKYPDIQEKIHKELTDVLGDKQSDITLKIEVYNKLNLLRAFIHEVLRLFAPGPLGGIRHTDKNYIVNDYVISKGSIVAININAINKDYRFWNNAKSNDDMNEIHLNYWLDKDGKFIKNESFYTFAYGKRDCVGRNLAMRELMIILSHLFMRYKFKNGGDEIWDIKYKVEHLLHALPMNVDIELRS